MQGLPPFAEVLAQFNADPGNLVGRVPGIWLVDKPVGPSSNLAVVRARKYIGTKKVGHAGTLDPMAEGLLVLLAGNATRLFDQMQTFPKTYVATFRLGQRTDSQDATGQPLDNWQPECLPPVERTEVEAALATFHGDILQTPPMHSALKRDGQPLYKLARQGVAVERQPRPVTCYRVELVEFDGTVGRISMDVSKGFYVRTLVDDLGVRLSTGAVMTALRRTRIGPFSVDNALPMDALSVPPANS